ncbi:MAG: aminotransferase [Euryarchaeota archaeon]|nr:aminotransferase [Euryarchaeota archaeon]
MIPKKGKLYKHWGLDPNTVFLNHGSFGATPIAVLDEQDRIRRLMERDPVHFVERLSHEMWQDSINELSKFLNADSGGMSFVANATTGVNTILRSLNLSKGDEIIVPDHAYQACRNAIDFVTERSGARTVVIRIPFRIDDESDIIDPIVSAINDKTVLAMIDTVSSPTGIRMPFEKLVGLIQERGVDVLVDAAHGPGIVPLNIRKLNAAYITGNCHKWICTPKGSAFLHIRDDRREGVKPLTIGHGYSSDLPSAEKFRMEFDWTGTRDPSPWLCIPFAISHIGGLINGGWEKIMNKNHEMAIFGRDLLCETLDISPPTPDSMVSSMSSVEFPWDEDVGPAPIDGDPIHNTLFDEYRIQVPVISWPNHNRKYLRISAQIYNSKEDYEYLSDSLISILGS